jgi:hypothetical protein
MNVAEVVQLLEAWTNLSSRLQAVETKLEQVLMSQAELNTDVQNLQVALGTIQTAEVANTAAVNAAAAELASLKEAVAAGQPLDLSGLEAVINGSADGATPGLVAAAASVTAGVNAVAGLVPSTEAPTA